jgi:ribosome-associated protein
VTDSKPSKSERKREQLELQRLGESLISLDARTLAALPLSDQLREAVLQASRLRSRQALRRQKQLIGKLMRGVDPEPIRAAVARLTADDAAAKRLFAQAERWRDRLVAEGTTALDEFAAATGVSDKELAAWLGELDACVNERAEKSLRREIFRRVHAILVKIQQ